MDEVIKLFHGSTVQVSNPMILQSNRNLDFGAGFYTTTNRNQAEDFARRVASQRKSSLSILNIYDFDFAAAKKSLSVLQFLKPNGQWLDFVSANRIGTYNGKEYDLIIGPVANDDVFTTVNFYISGTFSRTETLSRLKVKKLFNQFVFHSDKALSFLKYSESKELL